VRDALFSSVALLSLREPSDTLFQPLPPSAFPLYFLYTSLFPFTCSRNSLLLSLAEILGAFVTAYESRLKSLFLVFGLQPPGDYFIR